MRSMAPAAARRVTQRGGRTVRVLGHRVTFKAEAAQTGGAYSLFEAVMAPGAAVPPHYGRYDDETLWVLEGTFSLRLGDETVALAPGSYAFVPRGTVHALTNVGGGPGRLLLFVTPGGLREKLFDDIGGPRGVPGALTGPADVERAAAIAARYGTELLYPRAVGPGPPAAKRQPGEPEKKEDESAKAHGDPDHGG